MSRNIRKGQSLPDCEDAWLDDESSGGKSAGKGKRKSKKQGAKGAVSTEVTPANAVVTEVFPNQCRISLDEGGEEILCSYRRVQLLSSSQSAEGWRERTPVALGDRVFAEKLNPQSGVIESISPRRNFLARPAPGRELEIHVVAANVDLLIIVASVEQPRFSPGLIDRYLIAAQAAGIPILICVTKADLLKGGFEKLWEAYGELGYPWALVCSKTNLGIEELKNKVKGNTVVFCGHSGVGKTSLFRALTGRDVGKIGDVNAQTGKGRHTTTSSVMYRDVEDGSNWIDTPGVREFGLIGLTPEGLSTFFPEFARLDCSLHGCHHLGEEGCQAAGLFRHASYRRIHESLLEAAARR